MKKLPLLLLALTFFTFSSYAQEDNANPNNQDTTDLYHQYNHWSIELQGGVTKPSTPFADGYWSNTPDFYQASLGVRYMINPRFGLKLNFGYNRFINGKGSNHYKSHIDRTSLEGVVNLGNIFKFRKWTNTVNFLVHAGGGYQTLVPDEPFDKKAFGDNMLFVTLGFTPEFKVGNHFAITTDLTFNGNIRQHYTFDGTENYRADKNKRQLGFNGFYVDYSIGLTYYLGKRDVHADYFVTESQEKKKLKNLQNLVAQLKKQMDKNGDNLDKLKDKVNNININKGGNNNVMGLTYNQLLTNLVNDQFICVFFPFDKDNPQPYSADALRYVMIYMKKNPDANIEIIGYADQLGTNPYNLNLSKRRAKHVKDILVAAGVDASRMTIKGMGEDRSVDPNSKWARQLVRRVVFRVVE